MHVSRVFLRLLRSFRQFNLEAVKACDLPHRHTTPNLTLSATLANFDAVCVPFSLVSTHYTGGRCLPDDLHQSATSSATNSRFTSHLCIVCPSSAIVVSVFSWLFSCTSSSYFDLSRYFDRDSESSTIWGFSRLFVIT